MNALQQMLAAGRRMAAGRRKARYELNGRPVSISTLARELGVSDVAIHKHMKKKQCGLKEAVAHFRARRYAREKQEAEARAVDDIMAILNEGGKANE